MSSDTMFELSSTSSDNTTQIGESIGKQLRGGETIELVGDLGAGKTQLVRGLAKGIGSTDEVQSPTFTLKREYTGDKVNIYHYDFYRLPDPGLMSEELAESLEDDKGVVVVEWSDIVESVLPKNRTTINIIATGENERKISINRAPKSWKEIK